jgi:hypothetical protein
MRSFLGADGPQAASHRKCVMVSPFERLPSADEVAKVLVHPRHLSAGIPDGLKRSVET